MKNVLKLLAGFFIALILTPFSSAYNSDEIINIYVTGKTSWTEMYVVPEGKDLYLEKVFINDDHLNDYLQIRNDLWPILMNIAGGTNSLDDLDLIIKDNLQVLQNDASDNYTFVWFLVSEDESMTKHIQGTANAWNKHIFDKVDIDFIYFREFIVFSFMIILKFFSIIIGRKSNIF